MNKIKEKQFPQKETHHHNQGIYQNTTNLISIIFISHYANILNRLNSLLFVEKLNENKEIR